MESPLNHLSVILGMLVGFRTPHLLLLLPIALVVGYVLLMRGESRRDRLRAVIGFRRGDADSRRRVFAPLTLLFLGLLALARPYTGYRDIEVPAVGGDVMVLLDVSLSMQAADAPPSRLEAAKRKVLDLIDWVRLTYPGTRVGITVFAGSAHLYCPLTADYEVLRQFAQAINTSFITRGGSGLAVALQEAMQALEEAGSPSPVIMLLSDGEDRSFDRKRVEEKISKSAAVVLALGFGSADGVPIPLDGGRYLRDRGGNTVLSQRNDAQLQTIAEAFRGHYRPAGPTDDDFSAFLIEKLGGPRERPDAAHSEQLSTQHIRVYHEIAPLLCLLALIALIALSSVGKHGEIALLLLCLSPLYARGDQPAVSITPSESEGKTVTSRDAYRAYLEGRYDAAADGFRAARRNDPSNLDLLQAEASAAFRLKRYGPAERLFSDLARTTTRPRQRFEARYNRGNALLAARRYEEAIKSYDEALLLQPHDTPTKANKELAAELLRQQQQQQQNQKQQKKNKNEQKTEQKRDNDQSPQQAEQSENQPSKDDEQDNSQDQESTENQNDDSENTGQSPQKAEQPPAQDSPPDTTQPTSPTEDPSTKETAESSGQPKQGDLSRPEDTDANDDAERGTKLDQEQPTPVPQSETGDSSSTTDGEEASGQLAKEQGERSGQGGQQQQLVATEAKRWLSSLPEAPVLLRRFQKNDEQASGQQW